jgi:hypothetical protein
VLEYEFGNELEKRRDFMKVKELKELLNQYDDNDLVIMAKDSEGNGFSPLYEIEDGSYKAETTWYGEVGLRELTSELIEAGYSEEDVLENGENAIILWPASGAMLRRWYLSLERSPCTTRRA